MTDRLADALTRRPYVSLATLLVVFFVLAAGLPLTAEQADDFAFLPPSSDIAEADDVLAESFPDSAGLSNVTVIHRGDVLTPAGLAHIDAVTDAAVAEPEVAERLAASSPVVSLAAVFSEALQTDELGEVSQAEIDAAAADPRVSPFVDRLSGETDDGTIAVTRIQLRTLDGEDAPEDAELLVADIVEDVEGPLEVRSLSKATRDQEADESIASSTLFLVALSLLVIAALLGVFYRTVSDVVLSMLGLAITIVGTLGFQGLIGPNGLDVIGPPNRTTTLVPIMLIGLVVDYSIQSVGRYRELRADGVAVRRAASRGLSLVMLPLGLAGATTMISFLTNLSSPIPANGDFGIVAAFGIGFGLITMLTLMPNARLLLDRRRAAKGDAPVRATMTDAVPGADAVATRLGGFASKAPLVVLGATAALTVGLGASATQISTEFDADDFLPPDGQTVSDGDDLEAVGGEVQIATILIEAELTDDRTLYDLFVLTDAFAEETTRPTDAVTDIELSLPGLLVDWTTDDGGADDRYDAELAAMTESALDGLDVDSEQAQAVLDRLESLDPDAFALVAVNDPDGPDTTMLQYTALAGDIDSTQAMVDDIEALWFGDGDQITVTSTSIVGLEITTAMTESQTLAIVITISAALLVLILFFWVTEFKPMLAVIAVLPIVLVLIWVLGSMALIGIPYNVITALITALAIGIGVDYTIHVIHRFTEEHHEGKSVDEATAATLATTGSALFGSALTTTLAFAALTLSPLSPFQQFGIVTGLTILYSLIASIVVVPAMLVLWAKYHQWRFGDQAHPTSADTTDRDTSATLADDDGEVPVGADADAGIDAAAGAAVDPADHVTA
ncbi:MAG: MMPL family transporter [Actinomycetota bacterium]